jgi:hypothetical protein
MQEFVAQGNEFRKMTDIIKIFIDILLLRSGPQDLPTSKPLLGICFAVLVALQAALGTWLIPGDGSIVPQAILSTLITLAWVALVLQLSGKPERFVQTATALLGVACLFAPISIPLVSTIRPEVGQPVAVTPLALVAFALSIFLIYVNARILRAATERSMFQCVMLFMAGELFTFFLLVSLGLGVDAPAAS